LTIWSDWRTRDGVPSGRIDRGLACSLALHGLVALLLITVLPELRPPPVTIPDALSVDLVLGERTESPPGPRAELPRQSAPATATPAPLTTAPKRLSRPGPTAKPPADFDARLRAELRSRGGHGSGDGAASGAGPLGVQATISLRDLLRAQIERHWEFDVASLGEARWRVSVHVVIEGDGSVVSASVVDDPRYRTDPAYHALARSARNAVLVSSPLQLPPSGLPPELRDLVLEFDPRRALR